MIYAIAAYTITLGVLALYTVLLQHRRRVYVADQNVMRAAGDDGAVRVGALPGFNLGAALLAPFWMVRHGMPIAGALLLMAWLAIVPLYASEQWLALLLVGAIPLAAGAALGFVGNRIASAHRGPESVAAFSTSQLPWATAGVTLHTIVLPWAWYFAFYAG